MDKQENNTTNNILLDLYDLKLEEFKSTGSRDKPEKLLALLLLPDMDKYESLMVEEEKFYKEYKVQIDKKISKVEQDFEITEEDIIHYIEENGVCCDDFEQDKIWFVFCEGFGSMHWALMYHPEMKPEEVYETWFEEKIELQQSNNKVKQIGTMKKKEGNI